MRRLLVGACAAALLGLAPAAHAADVTSFGGDLKVFAGPENDAITVTFGSPTRIEDATAPLQAQQGCAQVDAHVAACDTFAFGITNVLLGSGDDTATVNGGGRVWVFGDDGDDTIWVNEPLTTGGAFGGRGNDHLTLGSFNSGALIGGSGDDVLDMTSDGWGDLEGEAGNDVLLGGVHDDTIAPGPGDDRVDGGGGDDVVYPDSGADDVSGGPGDDTMIYGGDAIHATLDDVANDGEPGEHDNVHTDVENLDASLASSATLVGDAAGNALTCATSCTIQGGDGNDVLAAIDSGTVDGGDGDDELQLWLPGGAVDLHGGAGTDTVTEAQGAPGDPVRISLDDAANDGVQPGGTANVHTDVENLTGGAADDSLVGDDGPNVLRGGSGDDVLLPEGGADTVHGDDGRDMVSYVHGTQGVHVTLDGAADDGAPGQGENVFPDVEIVWGTNEDDEIRSGGGLHDLTLIGNAGDDILAGGPGRDELVGGEGSDVLSGGIGEDRADFLDHDWPVTVTLDGLRNDGSPGENDWVLADVEDIGGTSYDDTLIGSDVGNVIDGWNGNDVIDLGGGADDVNGGLGDDTITAADGIADKVFCNDGNDRATVDATDVVTACEAVTVTTPPAAPPAVPPAPPAPPVPPAVPPAPPVTPLPRPPVPATRLTHVAVLRRSTLAVTLACPKTRWGACRGSLTATATDGRTRALGHVSFTVPAGATRTLRIAIAHPARQALAHRSTLHAVLRATVSGNGHSRTVVRRVTLHLA